ncbi:hypothetical protein AYB33_17640 [Leptospira santarosai]|uniref:DUF4209 domain-containing protein n=1 Tax=Leptospira santarosai TaxID=28183 RepID=UPI00077828B5|nr:DUF4209 domain-containing protein [Leptospira santarosai]KXZ29008.1 hypothetical protein AYB33_17640 [Leptospira santarosai]
MKQIIIRKNDKLPFDLVVENADHPIGSCFLLRDFISEYKKQIPGNDSEKILERLEVLYYFCTVYFNLDSPTEPYFISSDITDNPGVEDILEMVDFIEHQDLKAKVLDIDWVLRRKALSGTKAAELYISVANSVFDQDNCFDAANRIHRSLQLAQLLNQQKTIDLALRFIKEKLLEINGNDSSYFTYRFSKFYLEHCQTYDNDIVKNLKIAAFKSRKKEQFDKEGRLWNLVSAFYNNENKEYARRRAQLLEVRAIRNHAYYRKKTDGNSLVAASFMQDTISKLKDIRNSSKLRAKLLIELKNLQEDAVSSFGVFSIPVDFQSTIEEIRSLFEVEDVEDAIFNFISIYIPPNLERTKQQVIKNRKEFAFKSIFARTKYDHRSKVSSVNNPSSQHEEDNDENLADIIEDYNLNQSFVGRTVVFALREINSRFRISMEVIESLVNNSLVFPENQKKSAIRALHFGFNFDMLSFFYYAMPLFEAALRNILIVAGENVLVQDPITGVQSELQLKAMLDHKKIKELLGDSIVMDLKSLLEHPYGLKLRHNLAHGMFDDVNRHSPHVYYSFLAFAFLVFYPIAKARKNRTSE